MPNQAPALRRVGTTIHHLHGRARLVLAEHGLLQLVVLDVEEDPLLQHGEEGVRLEEALHGLLEGLRALLLPQEDVLPAVVPGDAVEVVDQVGDVEDLGRGEQLGRLQLVAPQLLHGPLHRVGELGVLVLDDRDGDTVNQEHHVGAVALPGTGREGPLVGHLKRVARQVVVVDESDVEPPLLGGDIDGTGAAKPLQHLAIALERRGDCLELLDDAGDVVVGDHARIETEKGGLEFGIVKQAGLAAALGDRLFRRDHGPSHATCVVDEWKLYAG